MNFFYIKGARATDPSDHPGVWKPCEDSRENLEILKALLALQWNEDSKVRRGGGCGGSGGGGV